MEELEEGMVLLDNLFNKLFHAYIIDHYNKYKPQSYPIVFIVFSKSKNIFMKLIFKNGYLIIMVLAYVHGKECDNKSFM